MMARRALSAPARYPRPSAAIASCLLQILCGMLIVAGAAQADSKRYAHPGGGSPPPPCSAVLWPSTEALVACMAAAYCPGAPYTLTQNQDQTIPIFDDDVPGAGLPPNHHGYRDSRGFALMNCTHPTPGFGEWTYRCELGAHVVEDSPNWAGGTAFQCTANAPVENTEQPPLQCGSEEANPCDAVTGQKVQREVDYSGPDLEFVRTFNSFAAATAGAPVGPKWRHNFQASLTLLPTPSAPQRVILERPTGQQVLFTYDGNAWTAKPDVVLTLSQAVLPGGAPGWEVTDSDGHLERYDSLGRLVNYWDTHQLTAVRCRS